MERLRVLTNVTIHPSSLFPATFWRASSTPSCHCILPPNPTTAFRLRASVSGSNAARFASIASASLTSARAASDALSGGGDEMCLRCDVSDDGVRSDCISQLTSEGRECEGAPTHCLSSKPVVLEVARTEAFHQTSSGRSL